MGTPYGPVEYESDAPHCPVCGEDMEWEECKGEDFDFCDGTINCICEGMGGEVVCPFGCDELA